MRIACVLPCPNETPEVWSIFRPFIERFVSTWKEFPPGINCTLKPVWFIDPNESEVSVFTGLNTVQEVYKGHGMDLGAHQFVAGLARHDFQVNFTSRAYFHRKDWLVPLVKARLFYGPGLYGMSSSMEGGKLHICTRAYSYDVEDFQMYPAQITSRDQGVYFECGEGCLTEWFTAIGRIRLVVQFKGYFAPMEVGKPVFKENGFRQGDQSDMLAWDRHTDIYRDADPEEKVRLERLMRGE